MNQKKTITFYLRSPFRERAETGGVNFVNRMIAAFASRGFSVEFRGNSDIEVVQSASNPGYSIFYMEHPFHQRALTMRLAYIYPFWRMEQAGNRWEWEVAKTTFDAAEINPARSETFVERWQKRLYGEVFAGALPDEGYVYMPLQGRLLDQRSFQTMSPVDMIKATLESDQQRNVWATLHPKEVYSGEEMAALEELEKRNARLSIVKGETKTLVRNCSYVVAQNSSAVMDGFFHHKPAVLFGKIDFHHIACNVHELGVSKAFSKLHDAPPDFDRYLFWFLQKMSINAGRDDAEEQILKTVQRRGWTL